MIAPHGSDVLKPLFVSDQAQREQLSDRAQDLPQIEISSAAAANAVMLGAGYFTPLQGYMGREDALSVARTMHTTDGLLWPTPVLCLPARNSGIRADCARQPPDFPRPPSERWPPH